MIQILHTWHLNQFIHASLGLLTGLWCSAALKMWPVTPIPPPRNLRPWTYQKRCTQPQNNSNTHKDPLHVLFVKRGNTLRNESSNRRRKEEEGKKKLSYRWIAEVGAFRMQRFLVNIPEGRCAFIATRMMMRAFEIYTRASAGRGRGGPGGARIRLCCRVVDPRKTHMGEQHDAGVPLVIAVFQSSRIRRREWFQGCAMYRRPHRYRPVSRSQYSRGRQHGAHGCLKLAWSVSSHGQVDLIIIYNCRQTEQMCYFRGV